jgi:hypothetical protein
MSFFSNVSSNKVNQIESSLADKANKTDTDKLALGFITLKQLGIVADGVQVDYTFSGTGTVLDGKTRKRWISQSGSETANSNTLNQAIAAGWNIIVEKGNYVFDPKVKILTRDNLTIMGSGDDCRVIGWNLQGWNSHIHLESFMVEGPMDIKPPAQLELGTETWFNNSTMFDIYSDLKFYSYDPGITQSPFGIYIQPQNPATDVLTVEDIQVINCKFKNLQNGVYVGDRPTIDRGFRINNLFVSNCRTEQIWWHGVATNNGKNFTVENCRFYNHYCGMGADFSRGSINTTIQYCVLENCVNLSKAECYETNATMLSDNHRVIHNTFKYINDGQPKWHYRDIFVTKETGAAYIKDNYIEFWNTHENGIFINNFDTNGKSVEISGNEFIYNNALHPNRTYVRPRLFAVNIAQYTSAGNSRIKVKNNKVTINTTTATGFIYARNKIELLRATDNEVNQTVTSDFIFCFSDTNVDGEVKNVSLDRNKVDTCSYFFNNTRELTGRVSFSDNEIETVSNTFYSNRLGTDNSTTQHIGIYNNKIASIMKLLDVYKLSSFGGIVIRGNRYGLINNIASGFAFIMINDTTVNIDSFIYENNNFIDHSNNNFTTSMRFQFININTTNYSIKEFVVANNHCIMHEYFIILLGTGSGGSKLRVSGNNVEAKGAIDGRTTALLYHTGTPFAKGVVANNEVLNNYAGSVNVNFYSTYKGAGKNILDTNVNEVA